MTEKIKVIEATLHGKPISITVFESANKGSDSINASFNPAIEDFDLRLRWDDYKFPSLENLISHLLSNHFIFSS